MGYRQLAPGGSHAQRSWLVSCLNVCSTASESSPPMDRWIELSFQLQACTNAVAEFNMSACTGVTYMQPR